MYVKAQHRTALALLAITVAVLGGASMLRATRTPSQAEHRHWSGLHKVDAFTVPAGVVIEADADLIIACDSDLVIEGEIVARASDDPAVPSPAITLSAGGRLVLTGSVRGGQGANVLTTENSSATGGTGGSVRIVANVIAGSGTVIGGRGGMGGAGAMGGDGGSVVLIGRTSGSLTIRGGSGGAGGHGIVSYRNGDGGDGGAGGDAYAGPGTSGDPGTDVTGSCGSNGVQGFLCGSGGDGSSGTNATGGDGGPGGDATLGGIGGAGGRGGNAIAGCGGYGGLGASCSSGNAGNGGNGGNGGMARGGNGGIGGRGGDACNSVGVGGAGGDGGRGGDATGGNGGDGGNGGNASGPFHAGGNGGTGGDGGSAVSGDGGMGGDGGSPGGVGGTGGNEGTPFPGGAGLAGSGGSGMPGGSNGSDGIQGANIPGSFGATGQTAGACADGCEQAYVFIGAQGGGDFGLSVSGAGDVNDDGYADIIVGAPYYDLDPGTDNGAYFVYSGLTGEELHAGYGFSSHYRLGWSVSDAGDVDNDGFADVIVGEPFYTGSGPSAGRAWVLSGQSWSVIHTFTGTGFENLGWRVSGAGDVNNDGFDDVIVGTSTGGNVYVYSGQTGGILHTFSGTGFGEVASDGGDVNADGYADILVGVPTDDAGGTNAGRAYVFSGLDGTQLHVFTGDADGRALGKSVSAVGDINHDGFDDVAIAVPGTGGAQQVYVYSGLNGALLFQLYSAAPSDRFGHAVSGAGDVNGDGYNDIIVGAPFDDGDASLPGHAYVFSGRDGKQLQDFAGEATLDWFGGSVSGAGDVDGDGLSDVIVGAHNCCDQSDFGRAYVFTCACDCPFQGDFDESSFRDALDLNAMIDILFFGAVETQDSNCPTTRADCDYNGSPDAIDLNILIDYLFFGGTPPVNPCSP